MGKGKMKRNFARAYELFKKALDIDKKDSTANYCIGLMHMLGLVPEQEADIEAAVKHYTRAGDDARALNALGVIYYIAPDPFEIDPQKLQGFKSVRRDRKRSKQLLEKSVEKNNVQAHFNMGAIRLDETEKDTFSFSKAYDHFKSAASLGHTLAAYNIGVMHYTGLGTFKSCNVANAFLKHVVTMGEDSLDMQRAYKLVE
jgi:TPR repeat protein